jgi:hypothetical protein
VLLACAVGPKLAQTTTVNLFVVMAGIVFEQICGLKISIMSCGVMGMLLASLIGHLRRSRAFVAVFVAEYSRVHIYI